MAEKRNIAERKKESGVDASTQDEIQLTGHEQPEEETKEENKRGFG